VSSWKADIIVTSLFCLPMFYHQHTIWLLRNDLTFFFNFAFFTVVGTFFLLRRNAPATLVPRFLKKTVLDYLLRYYFPNQFYCHSHCRCDYLYNQFHFPHFYQKNH
jgi:hypothetical protein